MSDQSVITTYREQINLLEAQAPNDSTYHSDLEAWFNSFVEVAQGLLQVAPGSQTSGDRILVSQPVSPPITVPVVVSNAVVLSPSSSSSGSFSNSNVPPALQQWVPLIVAASRDPNISGVSSYVLAAMLWQESRGNAGATSTNPGNGETDGGLMQINPATFASLQQKHPELQGKSLSDPATNILAAAYLMSDNLKLYNGNLDFALRAYNSGSVDPSNPNIAPNGIGDPNYVIDVNNFIYDLQNGRPLPA
jgi:hypothetical protein